MRNSRRSKMILATAILLTTAFASSNILASNHLNHNKMRSGQPGIDPIITGANEGSLKLDNLPAGSLDRGDCPLCFHRDLLKKRSSDNTGEAMQPFPEE